MVCNLIEKYGLNPKEHFVKVSRAAVLLGGTTANLQIGDKVLLIFYFFFILFIPSSNYLLSFVDFYIRFAVWNDASKWK